MKKIALIGGPSSGKSTLIGMLEERGYDIVRETAKDLILARGIVSARDKEGYVKLQCDIMDEQIRREVRAKGETVFFDRGVYDNLVYCEKYLGFIPEVISEKLKGHGRYDRVFVLDRLPFVKEDFRVEDSEEEAIDLHKRIVGVYERAGYKLERIPVMGRVERLEYFLGRLGG